MERRIKMSLQDLFNTSIEKMKQSINDLKDKAISDSVSTNTEIMPEIVDLIDNHALIAADTVKTEIKEAYLDVFQGGKSPAKEFGEMKEFDETFNSLPELYQLEREMKDKAQARQEAWDKYSKFTNIKEIDGLKNQFEQTTTKRG